MSRTAKWVAGPSLAITLVCLTTAAAAPRGGAQGNAQQGNGQQPASQQGQANSQVGSGRQGSGQGTGNGQATTGPGGQPGNGGAAPLSGTTGTAGPGTSAQPPALGRTLTAVPSRGIVKVRVPGSSNAVALTDLSSLPVGARIDTRHGSATLTTAVDSTGATQTATFSGGVFSVRQPRHDGGYTVIVLAGARMRGCSKSARTAGVATIARRHRRHHRRRRHLWGSDHHGRFRTRGLNSVATVRGTRWLTVETCRGTRTYVARGAVSVHDLRAHRTVLVKAHHSYLARRSRAHR